MISKIVTLFTKTGYKQKKIYMVIRGYVFCICFLHGVFFQKSRPPKVFGLGGNHALFDIPDHNN